MEGWEAVPAKASTKEAVKSVEDMKTSEVANATKVFQVEEQSANQKDAMQEEAPVHVG